MRTLRMRLLAALIILGGCSAGDARGVRRPPERLGDGWSVASPARFGANVGLLDSMVRRIRAGEYQNLHSVLVAKEGLLVLEQYFAGNDRNTPHEIRSATKSIGSILTGIAVDKGLIPSEHDLVSRHFEDDYEPVGGWTERARQVEIHHLLSMVSGYDCDDLASSFACEDAMHHSQDWVQYSLDLPFAHVPGEHWAYNSSSLILVGEAVARASGLALDRFAERNLFEPLGIRRFQWQFSPKGRAWIGGGARMIPREMAKIGQLMANRGTWGGERLLSEEWIDKSTARQSDPLTGVDYGYLWQRAEAYVGAAAVAAFWASGNGGQYIIVIPEQQMVVVFTGGNYDSPLAAQPFEILMRYILPAFLAPASLDTVALGPQDMERLTGTYRLEFEPSAVATVSIQNGRLRLVPPGSEGFDLVAHSPMFFTGDSEYGPVTVVFEADQRGEATRHTIFGNFQRFSFGRR